MQSSAADRDYEVEDLRCLRDAREHFLYVFKGGSLRSPPAPGCGRPQAAVLAARQPRRRPY